MNRGGIFDSYCSAGIVVDLVVLAWKAFAAKKKGSWVRIPTRRSELKVFTCSRLFPKSFSFHKTLFCPPFTAKPIGVLKSG